MIPLLLIAQYSAPLAFAATGETIGQKSGVLNIGLEGIMLLAAYASVSVGLATGSPWMGMLAAIACAIALSLIQGFFTIILATDQVVAGTAVNLFALGLTGTLFALGAAKGESLSGAPRLPEMLPGVDPVLLLLPILVGCAAWGLTKTAFGLALRAAGEYPAAVESAGFSVTKLRLIAQGLNGLFAGLGGGYLALGLVQAFAENMTSGRGFVAIALVTFGRWKPWWALGASLLIGALEWAQVAMQGKSPLPIQFFTALPYLVALIVLVIAGKGTMAPGALGLAYRREK
ncbi:MAG: ABC transporter permease [Armatimonadetes bacterium]|nr:ABC transporter permease [Armatimonadota bacterium]